MKKKPKLKSGVARLETGVLEEEKYHFLKTEE
jgi:hypothetical protein